MNFDKYQEEAQKTAIPLKEDYAYLYPALGLNGEAGEIAEKIKKIIRDKNGEMSPEDARLIALELGDVLWYVADLAMIIGYSLGDIADMNIKKLQSRKERDVLHGDGDER